MHHLIVKIDHKISTSTGIFKRLKGKAEICGENKYSTRRNT